MRQLGNIAIKAGLDHSDYVAATRDAARKAKVRIEFRAGRFPDRDRLSPTRGIRDTGTW